MQIPKEAIEKAMYKPRLCEIPYCGVFSHRVTNFVAAGIGVCDKRWKISEKCQHNVSRDESTGKVRKVVCNDCGKILIYNDGESFEEGTINGFSL